MQRSTVLSGYFRISVAVLFSTYVVGAGLLLHLGFRATTNRKINTYQRARSRYASCWEAPLSV
jgi:hypothetical protein